MLTSIAHAPGRALTAPAIAERNFDTLVREALALLPVDAPEWTDHNPSDPGITLIELFAYFTDMLLYRLERIPLAVRLQFLRLLKGDPHHDVTPANPQDDGTFDLGAELTRAIAGTVEQLSQMDCAITPADFEHFARAAASKALPEHATDAFGARCLANLDLSGAPAHWPRAARGHVSVMLALPAALDGHAAAQVRQAVLRDLAPRCLLTTRLCVVAPVVLQLSVGFAFAPLPGVSFDDALAAIDAALSARFGQADAASLGDTLNLASIAAVIDAAPGVDYVERVTVLEASSEPHLRDRAVGVQVDVVATIGEDTLLGGAAHLSGAASEDSADSDGARPFVRFVRDSAGMLASVTLRPWEQLRLSLARERVTCIVRPARDARRTQGGGHG